MSERPRDEDRREEGQAPQESAPGAGRASGGSDNPAEAGEHSAASSRHDSWHNVLDRARLRRRARGRRRRRLTVLVALLLITLLFGGYRYVTSDREIERQAEEFLSDFFKTPVRIDSASFSFFEGVQVQGLRVEMEGQAEPIFAAQRLRLVHDPLALLTGRLLVREIVAEHPTINLISRDDQWNFQRLMPKGDGRPGGEAQRPVVYVENGEVTVRQFQGPQLVYQHSLQMSGVLQPASGRPNVFTFFASEIESGTVRGSISRGIVDMAAGTFSFEARATNVALTPELAQTLPPEARQVWDRFMPSGMVSLKISFRDDPQSDSGFGFWVDVDLNGVSLAYDHGGQRFHLEDLTGQCVVSRETLSLRDVHGVLTNVPQNLPSGTEGAAESASEPAVEPVSITVGMSGQVRGIDRQRMGYDLQVVAGDLDLLRMQPFASRLSPTIDTLYKDFQPAGRADVNLHVRQAVEGDGGPVARGTVVLRNARCQTYWFPYPIEDVYGEIKLEPGVIGVELSGRNGLTQVTASGQVTHPESDAGVDLLVRASRLNLDESLRAALAERHPDYVNVYDSLHPQGIIDLDIGIKRPQGGEYEISSTIHLRDASLSYARFPYRLEQSRGRIDIRNGNCSVDIMGRHGTAVVGIEGTFAAGQAGEEGIDLMVVGRNVPLDADLAAALPEEHRKLYERYHLAGMADMVIRAQRSRETRGELIYHTRIALRGARVLLEEFPYPVEGVSGELEITPNSFVLHDIRGANSEGAISASGHIERRGEDYQVDVMLRGRQLLIDRDLIGAIAQHSPQLWNELELGGKVNLAVQLRQEPGKPMASEISLTSDNLSLMYRPLPYRFENSRADIHFDGRKLTIRQLESRNGETQISTSGTVVMEDAGRVVSRLSLAASGLELDEALLKVLPEEMGGPLRRIEARGRIDLRMPEISYVRHGDGRFDMDWRGTAVVGNCQLNLGLPLDRIVAYVDQEGSYRDGQLSLKAEMMMPQGRVAGNEIEQLRATFRQVPGGEAIEVESLEGDIYGGKLEGSGYVNLSSSDYALSVAFRGIDLETFLRRGMKLDAKVEGGKLAGEVALEGTGAAMSALRARGALRVRETKMYRLPVIIQLLSALRLKSGASFESADADFVLRDSRYTFSRLMLEGPGLSLNGSGQMTSDGAVAMYFTTGSGQGGVIPALGDLAAGLRHELLLVEVAGTLKEPDVQARMLTHLTAPLRELVALIKESQSEP